MMFGFERYSRSSGGQHTNWRRRTGYAVCIMSAAMFLNMPLICGCGGSSGRQSIEGTVTLDGKPLEKGQITFVPEADSGGPTAGAGIEDGKFAIPASRGAFIGKFRVKITASRLSSRKVLGINGKLVDEYVQFLPRKYNSESQLTADMKADAKNHFEFTLNSK